MADGLNINVNVNVKGSDSLKLVNKQAKEITKSYGKLSKNVNDVGRNVVDATTSSFALANQLGDVGDELKTLGASKDKIESVGGAFSNVFSSGIVANLANYSVLMDKLNKSMSFLKSKGLSISKVMSSFLQNAGKNSLAFIKNLRPIISGAIVGGFKSLIPIIQIIGAGFASLMASLLPILAIVGTIIAIIFTLKQIWKLNVGGIQSVWLKFIAQVKTSWSRFVVNFQKILRKLAPLFKVAFSVIVPILNVVLGVVEGVFEAMLLVIEPVIDTINEIAKPMSDFIDELKKASGGVDIINLIAKGFSGIAEGIVFLVKIILVPIRILGMFFNIVNRIDIAIIKWASHLKPVIKAFNAIKFVVMAVWEAVKLIVGAFNSVSGFINKLISIKPIEVKSTDNTSVGFQQVTPPQSMSNVSTSSNTINNNQVVSVNTSREISSAGAHAFANSFGGIIGTQSKAQ